MAIKKKGLLFLSLGRATAVMIDNDKYKQKSWEKVRNVVYRTGVMPSCHGHGRLGGFDVVVTLEVRRRTDTFLIV